MSNFTTGDLVITSKNPSLEWHSRSTESKTAVRWGQRKLLLTTLEFICRYWDRNAIPRLTILYVGAAEGKNIDFLSKMFPDIIWILYDPRPFHIRETATITIIQDFFKDTDAVRYANRKDLFFISDIRTADYKSLEQKENEKQIMEDMRAQERWYRTMKPVKALLKFRLPYAYDWAEPQTEYLLGTIMFQPYAPQTSTETRLIPVDSEQKFLYDNKEYGNICFYHNTKVREGKRYNNPAKDSELSDEWDSTAEYFILNDYLRHVGYDGDRIEMIRQISKGITKFLGRYSLEQLRKDPTLILHKN